MITRVVSLCLCAANSQNVPQALSLHTEILASLTLFSFTGKSAIFIQAVKLLWFSAIITYIYVKVDEKISYLKWRRLFLMKTLCM